MILLRWTFGAPNAGVSFSVNWIWPAQTKMHRVFTPRGRYWKVIDGHARSTDPYLDGEG